MHLQYNKHIIEQGKILMNTTTMNIRVDNDVKNNAKKIFVELGMDLTTTVNIFLDSLSENTAYPLNLSYMFHITKHWKLSDK